MATEYVTQADMDAFRTQMRGDFARLEGQNEGRFGRLEGMFERLEGKFERVEGKFERLGGRIERLGGRIDRLDGKIDRLEGKMFRTVVIGNVLSMIGVAGLVLAAVRLS